jgi:hypothetical protein
MLSMEHISAYISSDFCILNVYYVTTIKLISGDAHTHSERLVVEIHTLNQMKSKICTQFYLVASYSVVADKYDMNMICIVELLYLISCLVNIEILLGIVNTF